MSDSIDLIRLSEKKSFTFWVYAKIYVWWSGFGAWPAPQLSAQRYYTGKEVEG